MSKKLITLAIVGMFLLSLTSALTVSFFYSDSCPHCQQIKPFINEMKEKFPDKIFNYYDVNIGSYDVQGVPTIRITTEDGRNIELIGGNEIDKYLYCELQEMSTLQCPTTGEIKRGSFFINE